MSRKRKTAIALVVLGGMFLGGSALARGMEEPPGPDPDPDPDPEPGDDDDEGDDDDDTPVITLGDLPPFTPKQIYDLNVVRRPARPRVNAAYEIKADGLTSLSAVAGIALGDHLASLGRTMTPNMHLAYGRQISMVRTNFRAYGVAPGQQDAGYAVQVPNADGTINPPSSVASAFLRMHDPWDSEMLIGRVVARLVIFPRGSQGQVQPTGGWQNLIAPGRDRTYGTIWLPRPHPLVLEGVTPPAFEVVSDPQYDWPGLLWSALGVERSTTR